MNKKIIINCLLCCIPAIVGLVTRVVVFNNLLIDGQKMHAMNLRISNLEIENKKLKLQNAKMSSYREISSRAKALEMGSAKLAFISLKDSSLAINASN